MSESRLYKVKADEKNVSVINETEFCTRGFQERYDIQEWIAKDPSVLGEELLIIAKEFSMFDKTSERADLVALDRSGNLVVIELKRDDSGVNVHWQAIKYASYFRKVPADEIVRINALEKKVDIEKSTQEIVDFTRIDRHEFERINNKQRIILASHRFAREVTSAILWLYEYKVDIKCVEITPFFDSETNACYLSANTILPVPGSETYEISAMVGDRQITIESGGGPRRSNDRETEILSGIAVTAINALLPGTTKPNRRSKWAGTFADGRYYKIWYNNAPWENHAFSYQLHIYTDRGAQGLGVMFFFWTKDAKNKGISDSQIALLAEKMKDYAAREGFEYKGSDEFYRLEKYFNQTEESGQGEATKCLQGLIELITPIVESFNDSAGVNI